MFGSDEILVSCTEAGSGGGAGRRLPVGFFVKGLIWGGGGTKHAYFLGAAVISNYYVDQFA